MEFKYLFITPWGEGGSGKGETTQKKQNIFEICELVQKRESLGDFPARLAVKTLGWGDS